MKILNNKIFRLIVILICIGIIIYESISLYNDKKEYAVADTEYQNLADDAVKPGNASSESEAAFPHLNINHTQLKGINEDYVAWLYFPYFELNYPVVQETEVDEYLKKTFDGTRNNAGCLFTDVLSSPDFVSYHDIIFGHNMRNGSMFGKFKQLSQSEDRTLIKDNPYFYVYTPTHVYQYEIFAYYVTRYDSDAYSVVTNDEEYDEFLKFIDSNSLYPNPGDIDFSIRPSILTLSTCSGASGSGRRFVIHGAKVNAWEIVN